MIPYLAGLLHGCLLPSNSFFSRSYPNAQVRPDPPEGFVIVLRKGAAYRVRIELADEESMKWETQPMGRFQLGDRVRLNASAYKRATRRWAHYRGRGATVIEVYADDYDPQIVVEFDSSDRGEVWFARWFELIEFSPTWLEQRAYAAAFARP